MLIILNHFPVMQKYRFSWNIGTVAVELTEDNVFNHLVHSKICTPDSVLQLVQLEW